MALSSDRMIRSICFFFALSSTAFAAFPVLMSEQAPTVSPYVGARHFIDATRNGRAIVAVGYRFETTLHVLDGRSETPTFKSRVVRPAASSVQVFPNAVGSKWAVQTLFGFVGSPPAERAVDFWSFDPSGAMDSTLSRNISYQAIITENDLGLFAVSSTTILNIASGQVRSFNICQDSEGVEIPSCVWQRGGVVGSGQNIWAARVVPSLVGLKLQLVQFNTNGQQLQVQDLFVSPVAFATLTRTANLLRVGVRNNQETVVFNITDDQGFRIQAAGRIDRSTSPRVLENGDWLLSEQTLNTNDFLHSQVTPVAFDGSLALLTPNYSFVTVGGSPTLSGSNMQGDILLVSYRNGREAYEWRNRQGVIWRSQEDTEAASFDASGNLLTLSADRSAGSKLSAKRIGRDGAQIGDSEALSESIRTPTIALLRGPNNELLSVGSYAGELPHGVDRISADGQKERVGQLGPVVYSASLLHSTGSAWVTQEDGSNPSESLNTATGARFFTPKALLKIAVGDSLYVFNRLEDFPTLQIFREGQSGNVVLPSMAANLVTARTVNQALANQDELRFVLRLTNTNSYVVMGVFNGQASERFRFSLEATDAVARILSDGSILAGSAATGWKKFTSNVPTGTPFPICERVDKDDGKGGLWSSRIVLGDAFASIACYTGPGGILREAITPHQSDLYSLTLSEDGDLIGVSSRALMRFRVVDGVVRHHSRAVQSMSPPTNIGDKLYFVFYRTSLSASGQDAFIGQTDLIPAAEVVDQYTRSGFE
jgi:hypothetical protein